MPSSWQSFDTCPGSAPRWRYLDDGHIEIENEGVRARAWPSAMTQWKPQVFAASLKRGIPPNWIAAILALESGGKPVSCLRRADGSCDPRDGVGIAAMFPSTATIIAGRPVTGDELMSDPALAIDLCAGYLRMNLDRYNGDFVKAAMAYNAGSVKCGHGSVAPSREEPCPPTSWNVVMGCVYSTRNIGTCAPSSVKDGIFVCNNDYPRAAIQYANAALDGGYPQSAKDVAINAVVTTAEVGGITVASMLALAGGAYAGWWVTQKVAKRR